MIRIGWFVHNWSLRDLFLTPLFDIYWFPFHLVSAFLPAFYYVSFCLVGVILDSSPLYTSLPPPKKTVTHDIVRFLPSTLPISLFPLPFPSSFFPLTIVSPGYLFSINCLLCIFPLAILYLHSLTLHFLFISTEPILFLNSVWNFSPSQIYVCLFTQRSWLKMFWQHPWEHHINFLPTITIQYRCLQNLNVHLSFLVTTN